MRLNELNASTGTTYKTSIAAFVSELRTKHQVARMGGQQRFYQIGNTGKIGIIYLLEGDKLALGVAWVKGQKTLASLYLWTAFDPDRAPDLALDVPPDASAKNVLDQLEKFIKNPRVGMMEAEEPKDAAPTDAVPGSQRGTDKVNIVPAPDGDMNAITRKLARRGEVMLIGRKAEGEYFVIPNMEQRLRALEKQLTQQVAGEPDQKPMEEQYEELEEAVTDIVEDNTKFSKAMIVTGAGGLGKTHRIMQVVESSGLIAGEDFVVKKGRITDSALYRVFIEQLDGLIILDDCDSVWKSENGANMLKNALDTNPVRQINIDSSRIVNTAAMKAEDREAYLEAASRVLRGEPAIGDLERFLPKMAQATDHSSEAYANYLGEAQASIMRTPPNQVDFRGRMIFISNLDVSELDAAVLTRVTHIHLSFKDEEILDFIESVAMHIEGKDMGSGTPLSKEQVNEVFAYVRARYESNGFKTPLNFRFFQKCFDYRRSKSPNWQARINNL